MPLLFDTDEDDVLTDDDVFENLGDDDDDDDDTEAIGGEAPDDDDDDEDEDDGPPTTPLTPGIDDVPPEPIPHEPVCNLNFLNFLTAPLKTSEHHEFVNSTFFPPCRSQTHALSRKP